MSSTTIDKKLAWQPCFTAAESQPFEELIHRTNQVMIQQLDERDTISPGILGSDAGGILALFHTAMHWEDEALYDKAQVYVEQLVAAADLTHKTSLCSGLAGLVWLLLYLDREDMLTVEDGLVSDELIEALCNESILQLEAGQYDYMHKGLGMALALLCSEKYALRYTRYFERVLDALAKTAKVSPEGIYWTYPLDLERSKEVSLGLSHGVPHIIAILSKISRLNIRVEQCHALIHRTAAYLLAHKNNSPKACMYPSMVKLDETDQSFYSRLAWCYGDMGIAAAFIHAGKATQHQPYLDEADAIISFCAHRKDDSLAGVQDAGFCHGAIGIAHIFYRFYHYSKDPLLKEQAIYWFRKTIDMIQEAPGTVAVSMVEGKELMWNSDPDLLQGIASLSLCLLSSIAPVKPGWDEILLLDID